jgi:DNA polymerase-1
MKVIALDTETYLIQPGLLAPPLVCVSFCTVAEDGTPHPPGLLDRAAGLDFVENLLHSTTAHLAIHNAAFDMAVFCVERPHLLPLVFKAYDEGRIHCTKVRDQMLLNARGEMKADDEGQKTGFTLADVVLRRFGVDISESKNDPNAWRLRYGELDDVPLSEWPAEAVTYAKDDAGWHLKVYLDQETHRDFAVNQSGEEIDPLHDEPGQNRAAFALHLMSMHGVLTDATAVGAIEAHLTEVVEAANEKLKLSGILKGKSTKKRDTGLIEVTWSKDTAKIKGLVEAGFAAQGLPVPRTDPSDSHPDGQVKMDEETLRAAGHPDLIVLADSSADNKLLTTYVPALKGLDSKGKQRGLQLPGRGWLIQPGYNCLVSSGRTSAYQPNVQNPPRKGGVRECFIPRDGHWYLSVDYAFIELCTWAQTCIDLLGFSKLADAIKAGMDPHVDMGVEILRAEGHPAMTFQDGDYAIVNKARKAGEQWAKDARQLAKAANFGFPGGLGAATFCEYAWATYGVRITEEGAKSLKRIWRGKWTEADAYFNHVSNLQAVAFGQPFTVTLPRTGFVRGGCTFTSGCNTYFQGLAARGAKEAMWDVCKATYLPDAQGSEGLFGCRQVLFLHDELILEVPADVASLNNAAVWLMRLMRWGMEKFVPDVPISCEPAAMGRWYKEAEHVYVDNQLVPWVSKGPAKAAS